MPKWGFLSNHALVLLQLISNPDQTVREIALGLNLTERAVISILKALATDGIVHKRKDGRRNRYRIDQKALVDHLEEQMQSPLSLAQIAGQTASLATAVREKEADEGR